MVEEIIYLGQGRIVGKEVSHKVVKELMKPNEKEIYWGFYYLINNKPVVDVFTLNQYLDYTRDLFSNAKTEGIMRTKWSGAFDSKRKRKRRLNMQEIKYRYVFELMKDFFTSDKLEMTSFLHQVVFPNKCYYPNLWATGFGWLYETLGNKEEVSKFKRVWTSKKVFGDNYKKYLTQQLKAMINVKFPEGETQHK